MKKYPDFLLFLHVSQLCTCKIRQGERNNWKKQRLSNTSVKVVAPLNCNQICSLRKSGWGFWLVSLKNSFFIQPYLKAFKHEHEHFLSMNVNFPFCAELALVFWIIMMSRHSGFSDRERNSCFCQLCWGFVRWYQFYSRSLSEFQYRHLFVFHYGRLFVFPTSWQQLGEGSPVGVMISCPNTFGK